MYKCIYLNSKVSHAFNIILVCDTFINLYTYIFYYLPIIIVNKVYGYKFNNWYSGLRNCVCTYVFSYIWIYVWILTKYSTLLRFICHFLGIYVVLTSWQSIPRLLLLEESVCPTRQIHFFASNHTYLYLSKWYPSHLWIRFNNAKNYKYFSYLYCLIYRHNKV